MYEEPGVDTRVAVNLFQLEPGPKCVCEIPDAIGTGVRQSVYQFRAGILVQYLHARLKARRADLKSTQGFLQRLLKSAPDGHHFAHRFHLGGQSWICGGKFFKGKARDLGDHIVEGRLERGWRHAASYVVLQLVE